MWRAWMRFDCGLHPHDLRRYTIRELHALLDERAERERQRREVDDGIT